MCNCEKDEPFDPWWNLLKLSFSVKGMTVEINASTPETVFELTTMTHQWHTFLETDCGFDKADPDLVLQLTLKHAELFQEALTEMKIAWDGIAGIFHAETKDWVPLKAELGNSSEAVTKLFSWMWKDAFDAVSQDHYDEIDTAVWHEKEHGLLD